jgi:hypothetical protein
MARDDAKLVPGRIERALADEGIHRRTETLVDNNRLRIARRQRRGRPVYVTVSLKLVFTNGIQDRLLTSDPKLTDSDTSRPLEVIRMSDEPLFGQQTSVGWMTVSVPVEQVETSRSEQIGFQLEDLARKNTLGPDAEPVRQQRNRLLNERWAALVEEEREAMAAISAPTVLADPKKRTKQQAQLRERLSEQNTALPPPKRTSAAEQARPDPGPPALLPTPASPPSVSFLPGAPARDPVREANTVVSTFAGWTKRLEANAFALDGRLGSDRSPTPQERQAFAAEEMNWRLSAKFLMNKYHDEGRWDAANRVGELLDRHGEKFTGTRTRLGP